MTDSHKVVLERRKVCYPPPKYSVLLDGLVAKKGTSSSAVMVEIIKNYFDGLPPKKINEIRRFAKNGY